MAFGIFNLLFNLYMSALGFSNDLIGIFNSLPALVLLGIGLPFAAMADRIGYRLFLLGSTALALLGSVLLFAVGQRLIAVLAAGTFALGVTVLDVLSGPFLVQLTAQTERVSVFAVNQSLSWVAALVGDLFGGLIPEGAARVGRTSSASPTSIRAAFIAMSVLLVLALPFLFRLAAVTGSVAVPVVTPLKDMLRVDLRRFARLLVPELILGIGAGMFINFIQLYFAQRFGLSPGPIGLILAVGAALTAIGTLAAPWISRRLGLSRTVAFTQMAGCPLLLMLAFALTLPVAAPVFYIRQIALNIQAPLATVFGMEYVVPEQRARLATALTVVWGMGAGGVGPLISGFLQVAGGFQLAFSIAAGFYLLAGLSYLLLFGNVRLPSEGGPPATIAGSSSRESITG